MADYFTLRPKANPSPEPTGRESDGNGLRYAGDGTQGLEEHDNGPGGSTQWTFDANESSETAYRLGLAFEMVIDHFDQDLTGDQAEMLGEAFFDVFFPDAPRVYRDDAIARGLRDVSLTPSTTA